MADVLDGLWDRAAKVEKLAKPMLSTLLASEVSHAGRPVHADPNAVGRGSQRVLLVLSTASNEGFVLRRHMFRSFQNIFHPS